MSCRKSSILLPEPSGPTLRSLLITELYSVCAWCVIVTMSLTLRSTAAHELSHLLFPADLGSASLSRHFSPVREPFSPSKHRLFRRCSPLDRKIFVYSPFFHRNLEAAFSQSQPETAKPPRMRSIMREVLRPSTSGRVTTCPPQDSTSAAPAMADFA